VVKRGEVWWFEHPRRKRRPVCVLTRDEAIPVFDRVVVVEATSTIRGTPIEVPLSEEDGMPGPCVLSLDSVSSVRKALLTRRITRLSGIRMHQLCEALRIATGC
jgi:mRNA interferase MazF